MKKILCLLLASIALSSCGKLYKQWPRAQNDAKHTTSQQVSKETKLIKPAKSKKARKKAEIMRDPLEMPPFYKDFNSNIQGT
jgi:hypothetical protein